MALEKEYQAIFYGFPYNFGKSNEKDLRIIFDQ